MNLNSCSFVDIRSKWRHSHVNSICARGVFLGFPRTGRRSKYSAFTKLWSRGGGSQSLNDARVELGHQMTLYALHCLRRASNPLLDLQSHVFKHPLMRICSILAEEAVRRRHDPAGGDEGAGTEVGLMDINRRHPGVSARQSSVSSHYSPPGYRQPLLVLFPAHGLCARLAGACFFEWNQPPRRSCTRKQVLGYKSPKTGLTARTLLELAHTLPKHIPWICSLLISVFVDSVPKPGTLTNGRIPLDT